MSRPNVFEAEFEADASDPPAFAAAEAPLGTAAGGKDLAVRLYEIRPGASLCPYHYEYVEEWLLVVAGDVEVRMPSETASLKTGDVICFPRGPEGAHKVTASAEAPARVLMFSPSTTPSVCVYPDSDKLAVVAGPADDLTFHRHDGHVDYYDGEA
jgi:uncharacterized cupin superfamily protein